MLGFRLLPGLRCRLRVNSFVVHRLYSHRRLLHRLRSTRFLVCGSLVCGFLAHRHLMHRFFASTGLFAHLRLMHLALHCAQLPFVRLPGMVSGGLGVLDRLLRASVLVARRRGTRIARLVWPPLALPAAPAAALFATFALPGLDRIARRPRSLLRLLLLRLLLLRLMLLGLLLLGLLLLGRPLLVLRALLVRAALATLRARVALWLSAVALIGSPLAALLRAALLATVLIPGTVAPMVAAFATAMALIRSALAGLKIAPRLARRTRGVGGRTRH